MKLRANDVEFNNKRDECCASEDDSVSRKKSFAKFFDKITETIKEKGALFAVKVGVGLTIYGCSNALPVKSDTEDTQTEIEVVDEEQEVDQLDENEAIPEITEDIADSEDVTTDGEEPTCIEPGAPLEGAVEGLITNTARGNVTLISSVSDVFADAEITVGGVISSPSVLTLGQCPNDTNTIAAFAAEGSSLIVTPQYRLDVGKNTWSANLPPAEKPLCPPLVSDANPVSLFNASSNVAVKNARVGSVNSRGEFSFSGPLQPIILLDGTEVTSPVILNGNGYTAKIITVSIYDPSLNMISTVYSNDGGVIFSGALQGSLQTINSKAFAAYLVGGSDSILPRVEWHAPRSVTVCLRSCSDYNEVLETSVDINATVTAPVTNDCGKIFAGFNVESINTAFILAEPPHLAVKYSISAVAVNSIDSMSDDSPVIRVTVRRDPSIGEHDFGEVVDLYTQLSGEIVSKYNNPNSGAVDRVAFSMNIYFIDPDARIDYPSRCGCAPAGIP